MTRQLRFEGELGKTRFGLLWEGFLVGATVLGNNGPVSTADRRYQAALLDILRGVSRETEAVIGTIGEPQRTLARATASINLTQPQHDYLAKCLACDRIPWRVTRSGEVVDLIDFVDAAERVDDGPAKSPSVSHAGDSPRRGQR